MSLEGVMSDILTYAFRKVTGVTPVEGRLRDLGIPYEKKPGGRLVVPGDIDFSGIRYIGLPDLTGVEVRGNYNCADNFLSSLQGAPLSVGGDFICSGNMLRNLAHAPRSVGGSFKCDRNILVSLEGAPERVGTFDCRGSGLTSLQFAPVSFETLWSDFGEFSSRNPVPPRLRAASPAQYDAETAHAVDTATVLQRPLKLGTALRLKPNG